MRVFVETQLPGFHMVRIEEEHNLVRFYVHGERERAEAFAKSATEKFKECLTELRESAGSEFQPE